jgi:Na+(H+)/acetate symporter ActP
LTTPILLGIALLAANLPWFSNRLFYLIPVKRQPKSLGWCLLELTILYFIVGIIAHYTEISVMGQASPQGWEFYTVTGSLFLVFAFPGFVYRYFWQRA